MEKVKGEGVDEERTDVLGVDGEEVEEEGVDEEGIDAVVLVGREGLSEKKCLDKLESVQCVQNAILTISDVWGGGGVL